MSTFRARAEGVADARCVMESSERLLWPRLNSTVPSTERTHQLSTIEVEMEKKLDVEGWQEARDVDVHV